MSTERFFSAKYFDIWEDIIRVDGHRIMTAEEKDAYITYLQETKSFPCTLCVGTNQELEYRSPEEVLARIKFTPISEEDANTLKKLGLDQQGFFPNGRYF